MPHNIFVIHYHVAKGMQKLFLIETLWKKKVFPCHAVTLVTKLRRMPQVYEFMQTNEDFHVDYNTELFAGMYFKPKKPNYPTILFFRTGSYTMMGGKCMLKIMECETFVNKLIVMYDKVKVHIMMK